MELRLLENFGLLSLIGYVLSVSGTWDIANRKKFRDRLLLGLLLGVISSVVMFLPVTIPPGATFDTRGGAAILSGYFGGPVAFIVTSLLGGSTRLYIGGSGAYGGAVGFLLYGLAGYGFRLLIDRRRNQPVTLMNFFILSLFGTACVLPSFFINQSWAT